MSIPRRLKYHDVIANKCHSLAWAELRLGFAHVFRKFDLALAEEMYVHHSSFTIRLVFRDKDSNHGQAG